MNTEEESSKTTVKLIAGSSFVKSRPYFSFDSKFLFLTAGNNIKVISTASGEEVRTLVGHNASVVGMEKNPYNHTQLISCSKDGTILTWDYLDGIMLKKFKVKDVDEVFAFYAPTMSKRTFIIQFNKEQKGYQLRSVFLKQKLISSSFVMKDVIPSTHSVAFGCQGSFVASINGNSVTIFHLSKGTINRHMSQSKLTCVSCHPSEYVLATGDETGRILVWSNIFDRSNLCRSVYHWHTLPVADLCFSSEGFYLYSGGGECVLVKWSLQREDREFLPRLGMPICHLVTAPDNAFVGVSHCDNAVSLVSSQMKVVQHIQGLSQGHPWSCPGQTVAPTGLLYDPRTGALVMSGRPGHLQFYSLSHDKQLYSVDIVGQNFITQERNQKIFNTQVEKAAIDSTGFWMSTVQRYDDGCTSQDIVLKVWKYNSKIQTYSLNTTVILPHYQEVNCLKFRPDMEEETALFVTTSEDMSFKTWVLQTSLEGETTRDSWACESRGHYHDQKPTDCSFKQDGTMLAVSFGCTVTLWVPSPLVLAATLSHSLCSGHIRQVCFGRESCSNLLVSRSDDCLTVWDTTLKKPSWKAQLPITQVTTDPLSEYIAAFSQDKTLFIFKPSSPEPCFIKEKVSGSNIIAAAFIPVINTEDRKVNSMIWQQKSQLYYLNKEQELLTVINNNSYNEQEGVDSGNNYQELPTDHHAAFGSNFSRLLAEHKTSDVKVDDHLEHFNTSGLFGAKHIKELLEIPSHIMPPVRSLCSQFMSTLLIPKSHEVK